MKTLIVEDELLIAADIEALVSSFGYGPSVLASSYTEALYFLQTENIDFAILDIQLSGHKSGIDVAIELKNQHKIPFVFLSSYEDFATINKALETAPNAYLQKPFSKVTLYAAMQLAIANYGKIHHKNTMDDEGVAVKNILFIKEKSGYIKLPMKDVHFVKSDGNYMEFHTADRKHLIRESQKNLLQQLPDYFLKVSKSFIVNLEEIASLHQQIIRLHSGKEIPFAPAYKAQLVARLPIQS
ncbi:MAG: response regulator transcription factor [Bacteroidetes bacterium]|nr:response regulator transcription factor [Bacteroidota bacterium]